MTATKVRDRDDLLTVMRRQREALGLTHLEVDEIVGLGSGHYGKVERMGQDWGKQAFRMTPTITNCLDALNLELIIAPKGEIQAEACARDVRLPAPSNVIALPARPMSGEGMIARWRKARAMAELEAKKKPAVHEAQRA